MDRLRFGVSKMDHELCNKIQQLTAYTDDQAKVMWLIEEYKRVYQKLLKDCAESKKFFRLQGAMKDYLVHQDFDRACRENGL